jgi:hypothetical protein
MELESGETVEGSVSVAPLAALVLAISLIVCGLLLLVL